MKSRKMKGTRKICEEWKGKGEEMVLSRWNDGTKKNKKRRKDARTIIGAVGATRKRRKGKGKGMRGSTCVRVGRPVCILTNGLSKVGRHLRIPTSVVDVVVEAVVVAFDAAAAAATELVVVMMWTLSSLLLPMSAG